MFELSIKGDIAAAHFLRGYEGPCKNLHGHTWKIEVTCISSQLDSIGMVADFAMLKKYLKELIKNNFKIIIVGIAADGLTKDFLGSEINEDFIKKIEKLNIHGGGEGGEYESLVLDCPMFSKKLKINKSRIVMENICTGKLIVEDAELISK